MSLFEQISDEVIADVRAELPEDAGPDFVAGFVLARFHMIMNRYEAVLYQP